MLKIKEQIKGYCKDYNFFKKEGVYKVCIRLNIITTPKFYCKDFKINKTLS